MFKYFNYKPNFLQITDNVCDSHSYFDASGGTTNPTSSNINMQSNSLHDDDDNAGFPNADNQHRIKSTTPKQSDSSILPQWQASYDENNGSSTASSSLNSVDNVSNNSSQTTLDSNAVPNISPKARKYMQYSQLHEQKLNAILEQINKKDN